MLVQPQGEAVLDNAHDERSRLARRQALFRLSRELWILELGAQDETEAVPHVFRRDGHAARQQAAEVGELADGIRQAGAQAVDVRAALRRRDQVDVALGDGLSPAVGLPDQSPIDGFLVAGQAA